MKRLLFFFIICVFFFHAVAQASLSYPNYTGYVNDFAHVLSSGFVPSLNTKLKNLDQTTTDQIAVVTVETTKPETIEEYSIHLADKWKVGQKGKDNGVIMLFAMKDRRMRIEVGRGLEGDLTDVLSKHIETDIITPYFKQGNYEAGIGNGVDAVIATITHNGAALSTIPIQNNSQSAPPVDVVIFFAFFFGIIILSIAFSPHTRLGGRGRWGYHTVWGESGGGDDGGTSFGGGSFSGGGSSSSW